MIDINIRKIPFYNDFEEALKMVSKEYLLYTVTVGNQSEEKRPERVFTYEFYSRLRTIFENNKKNVILSGEQTKLGRKFDIKNADYTFTPDLVCHSSINEIENQYWICEIKMSNNNEAFKDLNKIDGYIKKHIIFEYYIFLLVGESFEEKKEKMFKYINSQPEESLYDNTICIFYHRDSCDNPHVEAEWLGNIIEEAKKYQRSSN